MARNIFALSIVAAAIGFGQAQLDVKVSIYYETLCPDSIKFITTQFWPTFQKIGSPILIDYVPYGKASESNESGHWVFTCQHGPKECFGNAYHACAVSIYSKPDSAKFIECSMGSDDPSDEINLRQCAFWSGFRWPDLKSCYESGQFANLLIANGKRTRAVTPKITFIPTIILNDNYSKANQDRALSDFQGLICEALNQQPEICKEDIEVVVIT